MQEEYCFRCSKTCPTPENYQYWHYCNDCQDKNNEDLEAYQRNLVYRYKTLLQYGPKDESDEQLLNMIETGQIELPAWYNK